jgi:hypothetical protein
MSRSDDDALRFHHAITSLGLAFHRELDDADFERFAADLDDIPIDRLEAACLHLRRHSKRFPTVAHIREQVDLLPRVEAHALVSHVRSRPDDPPHCALCEDTGWELGLWCEGGSCGRTKVHGAHSFTRVCRCRGANPVYRERERARQKFHREVE